MLRSFSSTLRDLFRESSPNPSTPPTSLDETLCSTCSKLDFHKILRDGVTQSQAIPLGSLLDILKNSVYCTFCSLLRTVFQRSWLLEQQSLSIDFTGIDCSLYADECGCLQEYKPDPQKLCHRLMILTSRRPLEAYQLMRKAKSSLRLQVQLLEEDAHLFGRSRDVHGRRIGEFVDIGLIKGWLQLCQDHHHGICEDVWWRDKDEGLPETVRMVDVDQLCIILAPSGCKYLALSYVWGGVGIEYQTIQANIADRMVPGGLDLTILPATIVDSISLCRRLGERYLWIDALCIIQDSNEDKAIQIGVMDIIYGGSFATIFATAGHNAHAGLPGLRPGTRHNHQRVEVVQNLHLSVPLPTLRGVLTQSVWGSRGWTYQEVMLSRRRIIFSDQQVYFECLREVFCEDVIAENDYFPKSYHPLRYTGASTFTTHTRTSSHPSERRYTPGYSTVINEYSTRQLTNEFDAIVAVSALTTTLAKAFNLGDGVLSNAFRYGMLLTDLNHTLLWQPIANGNVTRRRIPSNALWPSWSWAGWRGGVQYEDGMSHASRIPFAVVESLIDPWYMAEGGVLAKLNVQALTRAIYRDRASPEVRYSHPKRDVDVNSLSLPDGTLVFYSSSARFRVERRNDISSDPAWSHAFYTIHQLDSTSPACGHIVLPSSHNPSDPIELIVLSRCNGNTLLFDEKVHGKMYPAFALFVMAIQEVKPGSSIVERVGVGIIAEYVWLQADAQEKQVMLA